MKKALFLLSCLVFFQLLTNAQTTPVVIAGSQEQKITSLKVPQQEYALQIMLPADYGKTNKKYPVLYLMDSQWDFPLVTALYGQQYFDGFVPPMIIVGVTWTGKFSNPDSLRARDYTPTNVKQTPQSGGADQFLSFMKNELFPFVESHYDADKNNRILMGCSLGGLFTVYTFFTQPDLFQKYVAATPALAWDNEVIYQLEKKYFENKNKPTARLYLCEGGVERGVPLYEKFVRHLLDRRYNNVEVKTEILENVGHSGTKGIGYEHGLQFAFQRPAIQLATSQLQTISGNYLSEKGMKASLRSEGNKLILDFGNNNQFPLYAASENELYATAEFLNLRFNKNAQGNIQGFVLERYGNSQRFSKTVQ